MRTKPLAIISDFVLLAIAVFGAVYLFWTGFYASGDTTDRPLLPLSVDGSRILLVLVFAAIALGLIIANIRNTSRDHIALDGTVTRYAVFDRLSHWAVAIGFVIDFVTAAWLLRWFGLQSTVDNRWTLFLLHYIGAGLIVLGAVTFVTASRVRGQDALFPSWSDVSPAIARLFGYLGVYGQSGVFGMRLPVSWQHPLQNALAALGIKPSDHEEKFLAVEKVLSFTPLATLAAIVIVTGVIKAAHYFFAIPQQVMYWMSWLHDFAAILTVIIVGAHLAAIFLVPRNMAGLRSMIFGGIPFRAVEHEFPAWADKLRQREPRTAPKTGVTVPESPGD